MDCVSVSSYVVHGSGDSWFKGQPVIIFAEVGVRLLNDFYTSFLTSICPIDHCHVGRFPFTESRFRLYLLGFQFIFVID